MQCPLLQREMFPPTYLPVAAVRSAFARFGNGNVNLAPSEFHAVKTTNSSFRRLLICHFDKPEAAAATGIAVYRDLGGNYVAELGEESRQVRILRVEG